MQRDRIVDLDARPALNPAVSSIDQKLQANNIAGRPAAPLDGVVGTQDENCDDLANVHFFPKVMLSR